MPTRCQVHVTGFAQNEPPISLYHHCDGYPENMVPLLQDARIKASTNWKNGCAGRLVLLHPHRVASFIVAIDPGGYDIELSPALHSDIEYLYQLIVQNHHYSKEPTWKLRILIPKPGFWNAPDLAHMKLLWQGLIEDADPAVKATP